MLLWKCCSHMPANLENSAVATGLEKVTFHSNAKEFSNYCSAALISHASKVTLKILQARLQQYMNHELPHLCAGFSKKQRNQRSNCQHPLDHQKSKRVPEKLLFYWLRQSLWLCGWQQTVENSERDGNTRPPDLPPEKSVSRSKSKSENWIWNNRLLPNRKRSMSKLYIVTLLI